MAQTAATDYRSSLAFTRPLSAITRRWNTSRKSPRGDMIAVDTRRRWRSSFSGRLMKRRHLLHTAATLPLLSSGFSFLSARTNAAKASTPRTMRRVKPSDPSWPSAASWTRLKEEVGGNLFQVQAMFESCATEPNGAACREATQHVKNPYWLGDQAAGTQVSGLLDGWTPAPSAYAIRAQNTADVVAGINFARENNLRLVI